VTVLGAIFWICILNTLLTCAIVILFLTIISRMGS
jgi:hypothetical protein